MYKSIDVYDLKVISDKAIYEKVGEYSVEITDDNEIRRIKSNVRVDNVDLENSLVCCDSNSLIPIESEFITKISDTDVTLKCTYKKKSIELTANTPKGTFKKKLKNNIIIYDNLQVYDLIGKLDYEKSQEYKVNILNIQTSIMEEYKVSYCCLEDVKLNEKTYPCIRVALCKSIDCTEKQFLLYSDTEDRKLIRAINKGQVLEYSGIN
ncbi:hypothetical protein ACQPU1_12660 [Clostridium paraputrificum]|uniref:hypothetical protein n=1 Tax=Clostridium paraputrificum TaxID=29363 RepID=UPI003D338995